MVVLLAITTALALIFGGLAIWSYMQYTEANNDVNSKIEVAVLNARREQSDEDEKKFREQE